MAAVGLGDQQRQAAGGHEVGILPHFGLDERRAVVGVEVERGGHALDAAVGADQVALARARDERHLDPVAGRHVPQRGDVGVPVGGVEEVELVLQLHGDDGAAAAPLALGQQRHRPVEPAADLLQEPRFGLAHPQVGVEAQPCGQRPAVPLGADVRAGPRDDREARFVREVEERPDVAPSCEVPHAGGGLVEVPRQVDVDGAVTGGADRGEPRLPGLPGSLK
nr:hypothetical protein GCM10025732_36260 [Glycomyces mayteni]